MQITDVKIRKLMSGGRLRAVVSITIDDMLAVHDIKVVQGDERLFVAMPSSVMKTESSVTLFTRFHPNQEELLRIIFLKLTSVRRLLWKQKRKRRTLTKLL